MCSGNGDVGVASREVKSPPFPCRCNGLERAVRVQGGVAAERSEGTLDAHEHSEILGTEGSDGGSRVESKPGSFSESGEVLAAGMS